MSRVSSRASSSSGASGTTPDRRAAANVPSVPSPSPELIDEWARSAVAAWTAAAQNAAMNPTHAPSPPALGAPGPPGAPPPPPPPRT